MKNAVRIAVLLTLALALALFQAAFAEPDEVVKGIFEALTAEDSEYSEMKAVNANFEPDAVFEETLQDDGITISVSGSEYMNGSWTFHRDGDYLAATMDIDDYNGYYFFLELISAVGRYFDMDAGLMNGYIAGLRSLETESDYIVSADDEAAGTTTTKIKIDGPWEMAELDQMVLDESVMYFDPLTEEFSSMTAKSGKLTMIANGNVNDLTMLICEYGELDELAYTSIINAVGVLQPAGWEDFVANYTGLTDAEGEGYRVTLNVDEDALTEIINEVPEGRAFAIVRFGE